MFLNTYPSTRMKMGPRKFEIAEEDIVKVLATHPYTKPVVCYPLLALLSLASHDLRAMAILQEIVAERKYETPERPPTPPLIAEKIKAAGSASKNDSPRFVDQPAYVRNNIDQLIGRMYSSRGMSVPVASGRTL
ncbi:MAG: hypothetical protein SGPRY_002012 [Prymnesium sp.]